MGREIEPSSEVAGTGAVDYLDKDEVDDVFGDEQNHQVRPA
jgi:hypothetical protein